MTKQQVIDFLTQDFALANLPDSFLKLQEITNDPHSDLDDVVKVVKQDAQLAASLLRLANSSMYSNGGESVGTIERAAQRLGFRQVVESSLALGIIKEIAFSHSYIDLKSYWRRSLTVAKVTEEVFERAPRFLRSRIDRPSIYTAGLLHDIGMVALMHGFIREMTSVIDIALVERLPIEQVERREFGFSHQDVGRILFKKWNLPESLQCVAGYHHNPLELKRRIYTPLVDLVYVADYVCCALGQEGPNALRPEMHEEVWRRCGLDPRLVEELTDEVESAAESANALLSC